ncbi:DUF1566 domain-containing protein [bacterium]|nr:DUF1566 domain-containing protein [bacterium]
MRRVFCLISVLLLVFAVVSCGKKKKEEIPGFEEQVSQEISAEEGGKIESSDGKTSIEIPGGALDENTTITMTIYDASDYAGMEDKKVVSKVVEFEPSGTIFKKPVIISMVATEAFENKIVSAAVFYEKEGKLSYSEHGAYAILDRDESGNPVMTTAAGDPIMLTDGNLTTGAGDPIMNAAAGDPIMLASAGDPIMTSAAGDPIMNSAAGDPIMMTTGHFTAYAVIVSDPTDPAEVPDETQDEEPEKDEEVTDKDEEPVVDDDVTDEDEITDEDEDIDNYVAECGNGIQDPEEECDNGSDNGQTACAYGETSCTLCTTECKEIQGTTAYCGDGIVQSNETCDKAETGAGIGSNCSDDCQKRYSKAICTGLRTCLNGSGTVQEMPVFTRAQIAEEQDINTLECPKPGTDLYGQDVQYAIRKSCVPQDFERLPMDENNDISYPQVQDNNTGLTWLYTGNSGSFEEMSAFCSELDYAGKTWRLPTPAEFMTIVDRDATGTPVLRQLYFSELFLNDSTTNFWTSVDNLYFYNDGSIMRDPSGDNSAMCVSGEEYGKADAANYTSETANGQEAIRDSSTNLLWQKTYESGKTWDEALKYCEDLEYAGYSDWRLPNINELTTLFDYSKTGVLSSFPGMTANVFASSTNNNGGRVWAVSMGEGRIDYVLSDNETVDEGEGNETEESSGTVFSVRCVRSDLDDLPEDGLPLCDEKIGYAPCRDALTDKIWSPIVQRSSNSDYGDYEGGEPYRGVSGTWADIARTCRNMTFNGQRKWRIPTIDELRTLVKDEKLTAGGICGVKSDCLADSCYNEVSCTAEGETAFESRLRDYGILVSGDAVENEDHLYEAVWAIHTPYGALSEFVSGETYVARCVFDATLPDVDFPYTQELEGENSLVWSSISESELSLEDATAFCAEFNEVDSDNWRVPTIEELSLLAIQNEDCIDIDCAPNTKGGNSIFGDVDILWSSDTGEDFFTVFDFMYNKITTFDSEYSTARVRCVSGEMNEEPQE